MALLPFERIGKREYWRYTKWVSKKKATELRKELTDWLTPKGKFVVIEHPTRKGKYAVGMFHRRIG